MEPPTMNPVVEPLSWMLGTWLSDPPGAGTFPTLQPFQYLEEVYISHVGQPVLNFSKVKLRCLFCSAQITRKFRLNSEGKLEQTVSMATTTQPMTQHLHITYKKVTP
ncbi:THAP domain-containing protein 4 [Leptonychotes weddellii]|uniref:THAP domain-containing protein 4 n=1 Tax=Leptonychotes weddellii TaxID=9713 RepID=A0A2U3Z4A4_LEPWE|nr:THAP domain-containing protein 4 [Leptonychotes weddellii]